MTTPDTQATPIYMTPTGFTTAIVSTRGKISSWHDYTWAFREPLQADRLSSGDKAERADPLALTLVEIPAGEFWMGSPEGEEGAYSNEKPRHLVRLRGFFMGQTPITQAQWREVAGWREREGEKWGRELKANPSFSQWMDGKGTARLFQEEASTDGRPVERVSWEEAMEFCSRLSQRTGRTYTLPSEAQWEYACRAGTTTPFAFGETLTADLANYDARTTYANGPKGEWRRQTTPVEMFPANAWGLVDMHGNVLEWCLDEWHGSYEGAPEDGRAWRSTRRKEGEGEESQSAKDKERRRPVKTLLRGGSRVSDPLGSPADDEGSGRSAYFEVNAGLRICTEDTNSMKTRTARGGSWFDHPRFCRSACRSHLRPGLASNGVGFRVVCLYP